MVKVSSRGKGVKHSFEEDVGVISILGREDGIIFLGGNTKFGGQGGFVNMFIVKRNSLPYPVNTRVVLH